MSETKQAITTLEIMATNLMGDVQNGNELGTMNYKAIDLAIQALQEKAEREKRPGSWISVSERLPKDVLDRQDFKQIKVLVNTKNNLVKTCLYRQIKDYNGNYTGWEFSVYDVIAWQPLPEAHKGEIK